MKTLHQTRIPSVVGKGWARGLALYLAGICVALSIGADARAGIIISPTIDPPVVFSVGPEELGVFQYLSVAPENSLSGERGMMGLRVDAVNNGSGEIRLIEILVEFPGRPRLNRAFDRDVDFNPGQTRTVHLAPEEAIELIAPIPERVRISLRFQGYLNPVTLERDLAPYESPTPGAFYLFPGKAADMGLNEYWTNKPRHTGGSQFFGYDFVVEGWDPDKNDYTSARPGGDGSTNEDRLGWGIPIHAMGDGVVLASSTGWEDNPRPGRRALQRMGEDRDLGLVSDVAVTRLGATRAASFVRSTGGGTEVTIWDAFDDGREVLRRGTETAEAMTLLAADALTGSRLVTAGRTATGNLRVILWGISGDGQTITRLAERDAADVKEVSLVKMSNRRFATVVKTAEDVLRLIIWEASSDWDSIALLTQDFAGVASSISTIAATDTRLVTALQTNGGGMKAIVWDYWEPRNSLIRRGEISKPAIGEAFAVRSSSSRFYTVSKLPDDTLDIEWWEIAEDGESISLITSTDAGAVGEMTGAIGFGEGLMVSVIAENGGLKNIFWEANLEEASLTRLAESVAGVATHLAIDQLESGLFFMGLRSFEGDLKVITWRVAGGGGNSVVILHGNCRVLYAHMREGSMDPAILAPGTPIFAGQFLGRMGNSGSSTGPHLHIHATRISSFLSAEEAVEQEQAGTLIGLGSRPIPFHGARSMRLDWIEPGFPIGPINYFSILEGDGVYFERHGIRPTWNPRGPIPSPDLDIGIQKGAVWVDWPADFYNLFQSSSVVSGNWTRVSGKIRRPMIVSSRDDLGFFRIEPAPSSLADFGLE